MISPISLQYCDGSSNNKWWMVGSRRLENAFTDKEGEWIISLMYNNVSLGGNQI